VLGEREWRLGEEEGEGRKEAGKGRGVARGGIRGKYFQKLLQESPRLQKRVRGVPEAHAREEPVGSPPSAKRHRGQLNPVEAEVCTASVAGPFDLLLSCREQRHPTTSIFGTKSRH